MVRAFRWLLSWGVWCGVLCLYAAACFAPAIKVDEGGHVCTSIRFGTINGSQALLLGWFPPLTIPWSANLLLVGGLIALPRQRYWMASGFGWSAVLAGLTTPVFWLFGAFPELLVGYYLWQASLLLLAIGALVLHVMFGPPLTPSTLAGRDKSTDRGAIYAGHASSNAFSDSKPEVSVATLVEQAAGEAPCKTAETQSRAVPDLSDEEIDDIVRAIKEHK